ncbi:hypothetical protein OCS_02039 [Ophiocordyceps sinensis CO18]|uniref:Uncharacterized protein n=1 Tax=Ophiocordyceps sinensis (strain Co18 / CGMCC 3.14243) TaxID=911162 RepID=T5A9W0_OPHSC|nr:hypothetical protein OCS_02039 [Ophiocordyceps sinensis CO18]
MATLTKPQTSVNAMSPSTKPSIDYMLSHSSIPIASYFWGEESWDKFAQSLPKHSGNVEAGKLIGNGSYEELEALVDEALAAIAHIYGSIEDPGTKSSVGLVDLRLSEDLQHWKREQHEAGRVLSSKGFGLKRTTDRVIQLLGAEKWPAPLLTRNTTFGVVWLNLTIGACDPETLYSNCCCDMAFYYEHGFNKVFPEFDHVFHAVGNADPHALSTFAGRERRKAAELGARYIRGKADLEARFCTQLAGKSARMDRRTAQVISFPESSLVGLAVEAMVRGFDPAAVMADMVFSSPATDVVDVGSDLNNSEVMNSFLNTSDITDSCIITKEALRRVYDAYSHTCARILTDRWTTPTAIMNSVLYIWHIHNDRHSFLRRIVLGYAKTRRTAPDQREGDMDEVFDSRFHTTGFSRPLKNPCDGRETCDQATKIIKGHCQSKLLGELWRYLVIGPLQYARDGIIDEQAEQELEVCLQEVMAQCWHNGLVREITWLLCHASHHAWQVNFLMEAAMFGSLLDDGALAGKLDRTS